MTEDEPIGSAATVTSSSEPSAGDADTAAPALVADRYTILGLLGTGGMGRVYRARDRKLDEIVALKMLRRELLDQPGALERFRQEVKLARRVTSPHVVRTFDLGEHGDDCFLTMEYVDGQSLASRISAGPLPLGDTLRIARATCAGIAAAHAAGVLHRDLKPDNVLVAVGGRIAITDFGIALASADASMASGFVGTPAYMAPEQVDGRGEIGPATDLYAFGAIVYEMLTGRRPFDGRDAIEIATARLRLPPPDPRDHRAVPAELAELVLRCMAREAASRPADVTVLARMLDALDAPVVEATPRPAPAVPTRSARAVAMLPMRASDDLGEIAEGLGEEIVDMLAMTRELRVRPMASVRSACTPERDPRELGQALGVDVVVEGSLRARGERVRITARAIGVADGFQLWAAHFDTDARDLLTAADDVARAVARALTVEIELPQRAAAPDERAVELYLEHKARVRAQWFRDPASALQDLERDQATVPDDPNLIALVTMARTRVTFFEGNAGSYRPLAERAVQLAPASGEAWLALGLTCRYSNDAPGAARAIARAIECAPGMALAQAAMGSVLLEAGALEDALVHLEAAVRLDPSEASTVDLPRAYIFAGRHEAAFDRLERSKSSPFTSWQIARFRAWRGERTDTEPPSHSFNRPEFTRNLAAAYGIWRTGAVTDEQRTVIEEFVASCSGRFQTSNFQFVAELLAFAHDDERALHYVGRAVDSGLEDQLWMARCPLLDGLRDRPRFRELAAIVEERAAKVLAALRA